MNFLKRLWKWRIVRVFVWLFGSVLTFYILLCSWINYAGARQWAATQAMMDREKETLDFRAVALPPVPEDKNFCAIPALKDLAQMVDHNPEKGEPGARRKRLETAALPEAKGPHPLPRPRQSAGGASFGSPVDLKVWSDWLRQEGSLPMPPDSGNPARDVLAALSKHDALFTELAAGLNRPETHWTPEWKTCELPVMLVTLEVPHYQPAQHLGQTLALRAKAAARAGEPAKAHESLLVALRLARASMNDPLLIGDLVGCAIASLVNDAVWEICDAHAGSAEDFRRLQDELAKLDFQAALLLGYRGELALGANSVQGLKKPSLPGGIAYYVRVIQGVGEHADSPALDWVFKALPMGLLDMNGANLVDLEFNYMLKPLRDGGFRACLDQGPVLEELLKNMSPYRFDKLFARITAPAVNSTVMRTTYVACVTRQAQIACALERWFIDHHEYPDSLEALAAAGGAPLPVDPLSGKPLSYRKTSDGKYALWCDGFDGKNDGGVRKLKADHPEKTKFSDESYKGDWVWSYQP